MDEHEVRALLEERLAEWRRRPCDEFASRVGGEPATAELKGPSGTAYQLEVQVHRDAAPGGNVRVLAAIDDGGLRAFVPLTDDLIMAAEFSAKGP